jgi:hypothetical protein
MAATSTYGSNAWRSVHGFSHVVNECFDGIVEISDRLCLSGKLWVRVLKDRQFGHFLASPQMNAELGLYGF